MREFWLMYSGVSNGEDNRNRELIKRTLHRDESIRNDDEFRGRADPQKLTDLTNEKYTPDTPNVHGFHNKYPDRLGPLLRNAQFCPGLASDAELKMLCAHTDKLIISSAEYDVLRDDGVMLAKRLKDAGCHNTQ